jgi:serine/threonine-protein kinase HipA
MNTVAKVNIWSDFVGAVAFNESTGYTAFEFDSNFLKKGLDLSPLIMPLNEFQRSKKIFSFPSLNKETYKGLPGLLADSLPDRFGNRLIDAWLAQSGRTAESFNSVERLCCIGKSGMGALEYEPANPEFESKTESVEIKHLVNLTKQILSDKNKLHTNIHDNPEKGLLEIIKIGTSAGGARPKAIIAYNEKTGEVKSGQIDGLTGFEYWIIKFDGVTDKQLINPKGYGKIEYAYYLMAADCGINMSPCKLLEENKRAHFMTKRFDRQGNIKLHLQTLCALAHFDYNDPASYSYEQAFQVLRRLKLPYSQMEELYHRMTFNVIARNQDDHTKNISFLMDQNGNWSLSPAYDVIYAFNPNNIWLKAHQMSVNGKREDITKKDLIETAANMNIKKPNEIIEKTIEVVSKWNHYAKRSDVDKEQIKAIGKTMLLKI